MNEKTPSQKAAEQIISQARELVAAPPIVFKLMSLLKKPLVHNQDLIDIIRYDENLTAKLLKLCNTAFFRPSVPVDSVDQAVLRLGNANILAIVAALSIEDSSSKSKRAAYMNPYDIWRQSVTASIAAKYIAMKCKKAHINMDIAFTAGLLHNIGMVVLNASPSEKISKIASLAKEKQISLVEAERETLGTDHAEIGSILIERWQLPENIVEGIRHQYSPDSCESPLPSLCHLAGLCAHISTGIYTPDQLTAFIYPTVLDKLGLTTEDLQGTLQNIQDESSKIEAFMMVA